TFDRDASGQRGEYYDSVYLYAYCPDMEDGFLAAPVYRRTKKITVALPDDYAGHEVHLYGMIVNEEGEWSETVYAGSVVSEECGVRSEELGAVKSYELRVKSGESSEEGGVRSEEFSEEGGVRNEELREPTEMDEGSRAESRRDGTGGGGGGTPLGLT
ncbi:MAG: hypothetical protein IKP21_02170, partial [Bacteroidales bacterium]|nr:hypothetical protein [Bacteroidales bacterium]